MTPVGDRRGPPDEARLFRAAQRVRAADRLAFLARACRGDARVAAQVRADLDVLARVPDRFDLGTARFTLPTHPVPASRRVPVDALIGLTLGRRYVLEAELGRGASGAVFRAVDATSGALRAVKVFAVGNDLERDAVLREIAVLRGLRVPGVVPLLDEGDDGPYAYLVMPLLLGAPFPGRRRGYAAVRASALGLLETLVRIHDLGVVHRDLKPSNVLVDDDGLATLLDVGASGGPEGVAPDAMLAGTFDWMAPEQRHGRCSPRSDLYAFALLVLAAVSGRPAATLRTDGPTGTRGPRAGEVAPDLPSEVAAALDRCLAPDPENRPASAEELLRTLGARTDDDVRTLLRARAPSSDVVTEEALRDLFHGTVRIHHLPDDAARELWLRTEGRVDAVEAELAAWTRAGLVRRDGTRFVVTRDALNHLRESELVLRADAPPAPLDEADEALVVAAVSAGHSARTEVLARATGCDEPEAARRLEALVAAGRLRRAGPRVACVGPLPSTGWDDARRDDLRRRLVHAIPPGDPARFSLLLRLPEPAPATIAHEALAQQGHATPARFAALRTAARLLRNRAEEAGRLDVVLAELLTEAMRTHQAGPLMDALREVELSGGGPLRAMLRTVGRAAIWTVYGEAHRALRALEPLPDDDPEIGFMVHRTRTLAARSLPLDVEDQTIARATAFFARSAAAGRRSGAIQETLGWHAFRRGRFLDAAQCFERAAAQAAIPMAGVAVATSAASAWIQVDAYDGSAVRGGPDDALAQARVNADRARTALGAQRHPVLEANLAQVETEIAYRSEDEGLRPDPERIEAACALDEPVQEGLALYLEAAIAWRHGEPALAADLARRSATASLRGGRWGTAASARALARLCGGRVAVPAEDDVHLVAASPHAGIRVQVLAMIGAAEPRLRDALRPLVHAAAQSLPRAVWDRRREVLSATEALRLLDLRV